MDSIGQSNQCGDVHLFGSIVDLVFQFREEAIDILLFQLLAIHADQDGPNELPTLRKRASQKVQKKPAIVDSRGRLFVSPDTDDGRIHLWTRPEDIRPQPSQNADTRL